MYILFKTIFVNYHSGDVVSYSRRMKSERTDALQRRHILHSSFFTYSGIVHYWIFSRA